MSVEPRGPTTEELRARVQTYADVMREAADNDAIGEPSQPAAEHTASEASLPEALRALVAVVEDVAWNGYAWIGLEPCVSCAVERPHHDPDCELQAALAKAEVALDERRAEHLGSAP